MPLNIVKLQKQILDFAVFRIGTYRSMTQKQMFWFNFQNVSDSFENIKVKIKFIQSKTEQTYFYFCKF